PVPGESPDRDVARAHRVRHTDRRTPGEPQRGMFDDGPRHNGMSDLAVLRLVPSMHLAARRDEATLREALHEAIARTGRRARPRHPAPVPAARLPGGADRGARPARLGRATGCCSGRDETANLAPDG